jgi:hypothetical protein
MKQIPKSLLLTLVFGLVSGFDARSQSSAPAAGTGKKPNILFIMGDDIGWMQPASTIKD